MTGVCAAAEATGIINAAATTPRALRRDMPPAAWVISIVLFKLVTFNADRPFK
jgi:hypothetical protein